MGYPLIVFLVNNHRKEQRFPFSQFLFKYASRRTDFSKIYLSLRLKKNGLQWLQRRYARKTMSKTCKPHKEKMDGL